MPALNKYEYDAVYRLINATGRKHAGQNDVTSQANGSAGNYPFIPSQSINSNAADAFRNYTEQYVYDNAGNIIEQQHVAKNSSWTRTFEYDNNAGNNNRLTLTSIGQNNYNYTYDAHGNMHGLETVLGEVWDFMDRFKEADLGGGGRAYYVYGSSGQRVRKIIERQDGSIKERLYLGGLEIYRERNSGGDIVLERESLHIMDDKTRIAIIDTPTIIATNETQLIRYQYNNHLDTASLELDDAANIISYEEYFPFGATSYFTVDATRKYQQNVIDILVKREMKRVG